MTTNTPSRLMQAISRRWRTQKEAAAALGYTPRQLRRWENGDIPEIIAQLEKHGVICIVDYPTESTDRAA